MKKRILLFILLLTILISGCSTTKKLNVNSIPINLKISRYPEPEVINSSKMALIAKYNIASQDPFQVDFRSRDLSETDLSDKFDSIIYSAYDTKTKWPKNLPDNFIPESVMEMGKNPGLHVRELHNEGITGKNVGIAIIDQTLLVNHKEYKDRLKLYEEIITENKEAQMHGPAVASIAVGKTVGVAPDADLYYIAYDTMQEDLTWIAKGIDRIVEVNNGLPKDKKIRVISISKGWDKDTKGYKEVKAAIDRANKNNIFVIYVPNGLRESLNFLGLGRDIMKDPDSVNSYEVSTFESEHFFKKNDKKNLGPKLLSLLKNGKGQILYVPMDSRTYASSIGTEDYTFSRVGGISWCAPYIAGLYALCCQVNPEITPKKFWSEALRTGDTLNINYKNKQYKLEKIVNPQKLIDSIKKQ